MDKKISTISESVLAAIRIGQMSKSELASHLNISRQSLQYKIKKDTWTFNELASISGITGVEFFVVTIGGNSKAGIRESTEIKKR